MCKNFILAIATGIFILTLQPSALQAFPGTGLNKRSFLPSTTQMAEGQKTFPPLGHVEFCMKNPSECRIHRNGKGSAPVKLNSKTWGQLVRINQQVNASLHPKEDQSNHGRLDVWSLRGRYGDCEDYALRKRHNLLRLGWPSHSVLMTTARDHKNRPHAVLIARTDRGDFVLDNLSNRVRAWKKVPYLWLKRQSRHNPQKWVQLSGYKIHIASKRSHISKAKPALSTKRLRKLMVTLNNARQQKRTTLNRSTRRHQKAAVKRSIRTRSTNQEDFFFAGDF